jgi:hypothetical protein
MKILKVYENEDNEITNLFKELKFHDQKHREVDKKLAEICESKIEPLMKEDKFDEAKDMVRKFYKDCDDFTFEKDLIMYHINMKIKFRKDAERYNL